MQGDIETMETANIVKNAFVSGHPFPNSYSEKLLIFERGEGVYLQDIDGNRYLDFGSGISVNALGYGRKDLAEVAAKQMEKIIHVSNLYATQPSLSLGNRLLSLGDFSAVHFGNSGSEANEAAIKFARLHALENKGKSHHKLLCFTNAFHGRTLGALSCTPTEKYQLPFAPLLSGVEVCAFNNIEQLQATLTDEFAGVLVEVLQGEGGMAVMTPEFAETLNNLCARHNVILIADEVQTGLGRCGYSLASSAVGLKPDIVSLSKPLAGGLPLSATLIPKKVNKLLHVGAHGTTFGGGPVTTAVAGKVLDSLLDEQFLERVRSAGNYLEQGLGKIRDEIPAIESVKGLGMLRGLEIDEQHADSVSSILTSTQEHGLLALKSGARVLRIAPPLVISDKEIDAGLSILAQVLRENLID